MHYTNVCSLFMLYVCILHISGKRKMKEYEKLRIRKVNDKGMVGETIYLNFTKLEISHHII